MNQIVYNDNAINKWITGDSDGIYTGENFLKTHLKENGMFYWSPWFYAYSRRLFEENHFLFPCHRKFEDLYLVWRILLKAEKIGVLPDIVYVYTRNRPGSTTGTVKYQNLLDFLWAIEKNICDVKKEKIDPQLKHCLLSDFSKHYFICCASAVLLKEKREKAKMIAGLKSRWRYMEYAEGKRYDLIRMTTHIFGFKTMLKLLSLYFTIKNFCTARIRFWEWMQAELLQMGKIKVKK